MNLSAFFARIKLLMAPGSHSYAYANWEQSFLCSDTIVCKFDDGDKSVVWQTMPCNSDLMYWALDAHRVCIWKIKYFWTEFLRQAHLPG